MASIFSTLKSPSLQSFRWFALNGVFANFSNGLTYITMTWILLNISNSIGSVAILMICFWAPTVFMGPLCGVIADRYSRKMLLIFSNAGRGFILLLVAFLVRGELTAWQIYLIATLLSIFGNLYGPASFAFIREIVPAKQMLNANAIVAMSYEIGNIVGMGSAGLLVALHSSSCAMAVSGLLFLFATVCLGLMKPANLPKSAKRMVAKQGSGFWQDMQSAVGFLMQSKNLRVLYLVQLLLMVNFLTAPILLAPFAKNILHVNVSEFGTIQTCLSAGVIIGGVLGPMLAQVWNFKWVVLSKILALAGLFLLFSLNSNLLLAEIIYFLLGISLSAWTLVITKAQLSTDVNFQARVQAAFNSLAAIFILLIYLLLHFAGDLISLRWLYGLEAGFAAMAVFMLWRNRQIFAVNYVDPAKEVQSSAEDGQLDTVY